jgi:hypothetical protein
LDKVRNPFFKEFIGTFSRDFINTLAIFDSSEPRVSQTIRLFCLSSQLIDKEKRVVAGKNQPPINVKKNAGHLGKATSIK